MGTLPWPQRTGHRWRIPRCEAPPGSQLVCIHRHNGAYLATPASALSPAPFPTCYPPPFLVLLPALPASTRLSHPARQGHAMPPSPLRRPRWPPSSPPPLLLLSPLTPPLRLRGQPLLLPPQIRQQRCAKDKRVDGADAAQGGRRHHVVHLVAEGPAGNGGNFGERGRGGLVGEGAGPATARASRRAGPQAPVVSSSSSVLAGVRTETRRGGGWCGADPAPSQVSLNKGRRYGGGGGGGDLRGGEGGRGVRRLHLGRGGDVSATPCPSVVGLVGQQGRGNAAVAWQAPVAREWEGRGRRAGATGVRAQGSSEAASLPSVPRRWVKGRRWAVSSLSHFRPYY